MLRLIKNKLINFRTFSTSSVIIPNTFTRFAQFASKNKTLFQDAIEKQNKENSNLKSVALELKDEFGQIKWPSFEERGKQSEETLPHIYFHRFDKYDEIRYEHTLNSLKGTYFATEIPSFIGWLGTPGIGKCK